MKRELEIKDKATLDGAKERLKQRMQLKAQRLRRYEKRNKFFRQNKVFKEDAKKFYRELGKGILEVKEPPEEEDVEQFWNDLWGEEKLFNDNASWLGREEERMEEIEQQDWEDIAVKEISDALGKSNKLKSPGIDMIPNYWLNALSSTH